MKSEKFAFALSFFCILPFFYPFTVMLFNVSSTVTEDADVTEGT
jgi:hypothetical protein